MKKKYNYFKVFFVVLSIVFSVFICILYFFALDPVDPMQLETVLLNYTHGFIPRGFVGSIYHLFIKQPTYNSIVVFCWIFHIVCSLCIIICTIFLIKKIPNFKYKNLAVFIFLLTIIMSFTTEYNLGRTDELLIVCSFIAIILLYYDKYLWLLPILIIICELTHEGYTFMYANVILISLFYKYIKTHKKQYLINDIICFIIICILFLYFAFIGNNNPDAYNVFSKIAKDILYGANSYYYDGFYKAELLGVNLFSEEWNNKIVAIVEYVASIIAIFPLYKKTFCYLKQIASSKKIEHIAVSIGIFTLLPEYLLKLDLGRWNLALFIYIALLTIFAILQNDDHIKTAFVQNLLVWSKKETIWCGIGYLLTIPVSSVHTFFWFYMILHVLGLISYIG